MKGHRWFAAIYQRLSNVQEKSAAGCHPNRDTGSTVTDAEFKFESLRTIKDAPPVPPMVFVRPRIIGVATSV